MNNKFILTIDFLEASEKNFRNDKLYDLYVKPLIRSLGNK